MSLKSVMDHRRRVTGYRFESSRNAFLHWQLIT
ncbi:MAG: hypothetical protein RLY70_1455, partial [Planctomycetota bacterium]